MQKILDSFLDYLIYEKNYSKLTINAYKKDVEEFWLFLKAEFITKWKSVDYKIIRNYLYVLETKNYSQSSKSRKISSLRSFYKFQLNQKLLDGNPFDLVQISKGQSKIPKFLYYDEITKIIDFIDSSNLIGIRDKMIIEIMYSCGIRASEITGLKKTNVDLNEKTIKVFGKGSKERIVPLTKSAVLSIDKYIKTFYETKNTKKYKELVLNNQGNPITQRGLAYIIKKVAKNASEEFNIHPHVLRHTFATHLLDNGADIRIVQEMLGHKNLSSTQIYTHVTKDKLKNTHRNYHPRSMKNLEIKK